MHLLRSRMYSITYFTYMLDQKPPAHLSKPLKRLQAPEKLLERLRTRFQCPLHHLYSELTLMAAAGEEMAAQRSSHAVCYLYEGPLQVLPPQPSLQSGVTGAEISYILKTQM